MPAQKGTLKNGTSFQSVTGTDYTVHSYIKSGTQGEIYKVKSPNGNIYALKLYFPSFSQNQQFRDDIQDLAIKRRSPRPNFVWPQETVEIDNSFGYIMNFADLSKTKMIFEDEEILDRALACKIGISIAKSMQALHINGMCYKDLSPNNFEYNENTGEVVIFDCDNINPKGSKCTVSGTPGYRAPEIVLQKNYPDDFSDIYSMATIFFKMWMGADTAPLEGRVLFEKFDGILDNGALSGESHAERYLYGTNPVFVFDPEDTSNSFDENDPDGQSKIAMWKYFIPQELKELFIETFTRGLKYPSLRPIDGRWQKCFENILSDIKPCPHCGTNNAFSLGYCIDCHKKLAQ